MTYEIAKSKCPITGKYTPVDAKLRFKSKYRVDRTTECWEWVGCINPNGYGYFRSGLGTRLAHRASYLIHIGDIPKGKSVCHKCDNKKCVNPDHLFIGTPKENTADAIKKGRMKPHDYTKFLPSPPTTKLNRDEVRIIRAYRSLGASAKNLGGVFGVDARSVYSIAKRETWRNVV